MALFCLGDVRWSEVGGLGRQGGMDQADRLKAADEPCPTQRAVQKYLERRAIPRQKPTDHHRIGNVGIQIVMGRRIDPAQHNKWHGIFHRHQHGKPQRTTILHQISPWAAPRGRVCQHHPPDD